MVKLPLADFADATMRMIELSGLKKTRLMVKLRPTDKRIVLKSTDQKTTLTSVATEQKDLKVVEQIIGDYVTRCTRAAPLDRPTGNAKEDKKSAQKAAKKANKGTKK